MSYEQRTFEVQAAGPDGADAPTKIVGYAAVFNQIEHGEMVAPGAFTKTLQEQQDIRAYWNHDSGVVLGRTKNGTLMLAQDDRGLRVEIAPNLGTEWGRSALASVQRGDVSQMSFGFSSINDETRMIDGEQVRVLKEVRLYEVSPVAEPWYSGTEAQARDKAKAGDEPEPVQAGHSTRNRLRSWRWRMKLEELRQATAESKSAQAGHFVAMHT